ncbi:MAG: putative dehydrogenase, partial [Planctomycetota bacterium]
MPAPVRIGLIGNSFASKVQLPALRQIGGNIVVGIAGADEDKARDTAREWGIPKASGDWRDIIALDCDLVILTTPVHLHAPMVRAALETRAAILCEKPFTLNAGEARELADEAHGRLALLDHQLRWSPWRRRMREMFQ